MRSEGVALRVRLGVVCGCVGVVSSDGRCDRRGRGGKDEESADPVDDDDGGFPVPVVDDQELGFALGGLLDEDEADADADAEPDDKEADLFGGVAGRCAAGIVSGVTRPEGGLELVEEDADAGLVQSGVQSWSSSGPRTRPDGGINPLLSLRCRRFGCSKTSKAKSFESFMSEESVGSIGMSEEVSSSSSSTAGPSEARLGRDIRSKFFIMGDKRGLAAVIELRSFPGLKLRDMDRDGVRAVFSSRLTRNFFGGAISSENDVLKILLGLRDVMVIH